MYETFYNTVKGPISVLKNSI